MDLQELIVKFKSISAYPELLSIFKESLALDCMIRLINHSNNDIKGDVIELFNELVQMELNEETVDDLA